MPVGVLHTKLLGTCKYVLKEVMSGMSIRQKSEVLERVKAFNTSGFKTKMFAGTPSHGDFKGWTQMAMFIVGPYLSEGQKKVYLSLSKVSNFC